MTDVRSAFLRAAEVTVGVVRSPEIAERWTQASVLPDLTVGGLVGHTYLAVRLVDRALDQPAPTGPVRDPGDYYDPALLDDDAHRVVRADGEHVARRGAEAVTGKFVELVARLAARLPGEPPDRVIATSLAPARLDDYLSNRSIELLVHADDLAVSVGVDLDLPAEATALAIAGLVAVGRHRLGDRAVLRALSGRTEGLRVL